MPQVNLSALNGQELRQLLDSSRRRGDASLSYKVLQEMAARREGVDPRKAFGGRPDEPRHIEVDLGEPAQDVDDVPPVPPGWRPPMVAAETGAGDIEVEDPPPMANGHMNHPEAEPLDDERPLTLHDNDPEWSEEASMSGRGPRFQPVEIEPARERRPPKGRLLTGLMVGLLFGVGFGWLAGWLARDAIATRPQTQTAALSPPPVPAEGQGAPVAAAPPPAAADTAAEPPQSLGPGPAPAPAAETPAAPAPIPQAAATVVATAPAAPAIAKPPPVVVAAKAPSPKPAAKPPLDGAALELPAADAEDADARPAKVIKVPVAAVAKGCETQPTPADKAICGDAKLKRLQSELRQAYEGALAAHEDKTTLRERQLAWRDTRSTVTDPEKLAQIYQARIRKLNAATAEALRGKQEP